MITLYELHWSHYCEKVRLALDYMGLPWQAVGIDAFRKRELRAHPLPDHLPNHTVPAIRDDRTGAFIFDSTPILRYLADTYPDHPQLFPGDAANRDAIDKKLIEFDTRLGLAARRFGYTQLILECPELLAELFLSHRASGFFSKPGVRHIAGYVLGAMLAKRFDLHRSESLNLYEALESYLLALADELAGRTFVVGPALSVADLALAAQLRPLTIVPFFAEHPRLQSLFERHRAVTQQYSREGDFVYQTAINAARKRKPPLRRKLRLVEAASLPFHSKDDLSANDQRPVNILSMLTMSLHTLVSLRRRKVRQSLASATAR